MHFKSRNIWELFKTFGSFNFFLRANRFNCRVLNKLISILRLNYQKLDVGKLFSSNSIIQSITQFFPCSRHNADERTRQKAASKTDTKPEIIKQHAKTCRNSKHVRYSVTGGAKTGGEDSVLVCFLVPDDTMWQSVSQVCWAPSRD